MGFGVSGLPYISFTVVAVPTVSAFPLLRYPSLALSTRD